MKIDGDLAEIIGIHIGDGCISVNKRYKEYYLGGDISEEKDYHDQWVAHLFNKKIMLPLAKKEVVYKKYPSIGIYGFYIFDSRIVDFFKELGIGNGPKINILIPNEITRDVLLVKRCLRGLFDTDGCIYFDKNRSAKLMKNNQPIIQLGSVSQGLIKQVFILLKKMNFYPRLRKPYLGKKDKNPVHKILIYRRKDVIRYINEIGFKNPKHYTKWELYKKFGFCPPNTKLVERREMLKQKTYKESI
jgi:intein/homing endonuclease